MTNGSIAHQRSHLTRLTLCLGTAAAKVTRRRLQEYVSGGKTPFRPIDSVSASPLTRDARGTDDERGNVQGEQCHRRMGYERIRAAVCSTGLGNHNVGMPGMRGVGRLPNRGMILVLTGVLAMPPASLAQDCIPDWQNTGAQMGYVLSETLVRIPVYAVDLTPTAREALRQGVEAWNARSNYTYTYFDIVTSPENGSLVFKTQGTANECAEWLPQNAMVILSESAQNGMQDHFDVGLYFIKHELAHVLAMADKGPSPSSPTIMNQLGILAGDTCAQAMARKIGIPTLDILESDLPKAKGCIGAARVAGGMMSSQPYYDDRWVEEMQCWERWIVTRMWYCSENACTEQTPDYWFEGYICK
jgi:hypothetical protein